ncbi:MAG: adenylate/guanylate cyclase domain-containing protein [Sulfuricella denitrificans]|nr:adenylate/guanylate cyclase domain-containing protein [Sulfuricella denitrificans]
MVCFLVANLVFIALFGLRQGGYLQNLELNAYDLAIRHQPMVPPDARVVLVTETEDDLQRWGFPLSDDTLARILERLTASGARVIGVDKYRDNPVAPGQERLEQALKANTGIFWVNRFGGVGMSAILPPQVLRGTDRVGFNDLVTDPGGIVRRGLLFLDDGQTVSYSLPMLLALRYLQNRGITPLPDPVHPEHLRLGNTTLPPFEANDGGYTGADAAGYQFLLDFRGMPAHFPAATVTEVLEGKTDPSFFRDKIVIVGTSARSINDYFYTPFSHGMGDNQRIYGVELFAQVTSQLLRFALDNTPAIRAPGQTAEHTWIWLWCLLGAAAGYFARSLGMFLGATVAGSLLIATAYQLAFTRHWWIPVVPPTLGFLLTAMAIAAYVASLEKRQRAMLMQIFSRHVSGDVARTLWEQRDQFLQGNRPKPQQLTATVLFSDIRGFTTISENLQPKELMDWLNEYMEAMSAVVSQHQGVVNKYIGDAVMVLFGVPVARQGPDEIAADARRAVDCALAMEREIERLNRLWATRGLPPVRVRIGIFTGPLVAGSLGGGDRLEYTVIGDTVNVASRLESYDKDFAAERTCRILTGENTLHLLSDGYLTETVGAVTLKGRNEKIPIHQVISTRK